MYKARRSNFRRREILNRYEHERVRKLLAFRSLVFYQVLYDCQTYSDRIREKQPTANQTCTNRTVLVVTRLYEY
jgi:hypothetical protein